MRSNPDNAGEVVGMPFWVLFSMLLPGFAILYLGVPLLDDIGVDVSLEKLSEAEKIIGGIFLGFLNYTLAPAQWIKKWFPFYRNTIEPLRRLITEEKNIKCSLKFADRETTMDDAYVFHNEFVSRLKEKGIAVLSRDYGYFIFAIFLVTIFTVYLPIRLLIITLCPEVTLMRELTKLIILSVLGGYLAKDARDSLRGYFRTICRMIIIHEDHAEAAINYIKEKGSDFIRPSPGIDYP